ncbi:antigen 5 like allergen Cul n 1 [Drosophila pseudoobscura]|uniref:Antigen 5 like allergen Cul n 1 n=1 Tax=Drosophila pseudoobscura pseudoobscura TaxID=46245 RepID=A0A6I8UZY5_DROPS|nr:antigen 5 like allergen Cul n 1 [Drosophila pseudoobscura]
MQLRCIAMACLAMCACLVQSQDYCRAELCPVNTTHIGCRNRGNFSRSCPPDAARLDIHEAARKQVVHAHNTLRQKWASGGGDTVSRSACRMATISWDQELARLAELNTRQCLLEHDKCHNTLKYRNSGQNLYMAGFAGIIPSSVERILKRAMDDWAAEGSDITREQLQAFHLSGADITHFAVMVSEANVAVGCAVTRFKQQNFHHFLVACNYGTGNELNKPVYSSCSVAGSGCQTKANPQYPALCSQDEQIQF